MLPSPSLPPRVPPHPRPPTSLRPTAAPPPRTQVTKRTALDGAENNFDLMYEQLAALKSGKSIKKPIYNHVNGTLDTPEEIKPTNIVIVEGLHPFYDERVRELMDFSVYLDISDEIKFAWKIQRDMEERGHSLESIQASIESRKPDFDQFVGPQRAYSDLVISVLPTDLVADDVGKTLKVKMIQREGVDNFDPVSWSESQPAVPLAQRSPSPD